MTDGRTAAVTSQQFAESKARDLGARVQPVDVFDGYHLAAIIGTTRDVNHCTSSNQNSRLLRQLVNRLSDNTAANLSLVEPPQRETVCRLPLFTPTN